MSENDFKKRKMEFTKLKAALFKLREDPIEKKVFDYFDFISWAECKIRRKPFAEVLQGKNK